jgi:hypothetical protein
MAREGTFEVEGRTFRFRKPHIGAVRAFDEFLHGDEKGRLSGYYAATLSVVLDAVHRVDPTVTEAELDALLDEDSLTDFMRAIQRLSGTGDSTGEAARP